jgi:hypothetical protein
MPAAFAAPSPGSPPLAPIAAPARPSRSRWKLYVASGALLVGAAAGVAYFVTPVGAFSSAPTSADPVAAQTRVYLQQVVPTCITSCAPNGSHGSVRASVHTLPSGETQPMRVDVNDSATPEDVAVAQCVSNCLSTIRSPATEAGMSFDDLVIAY